MKTTLKRGFGRGAAVNGNGRAVIPPGALSPVTLYRQPPPAKPGFAKLVGKFAWTIPVRQSINLHIREVFDCPGLWWARDHLLSQLLIHSGDSIQ